MILKNFFDLTCLTLDKAALLKIVNNLNRDTSDTVAPPTIIGSLNIHALALIDQNKEFQKFNQSLRFAYIDGMPVIWLLKLLGYKVTSKNRITALDWHRDFFKLANVKKLNIYCLGASASSIRKAVEKLKHIYTNINFDFHHGYIGNNQIPENLKGNIDILLIGMGMPKQELWIEANYKLINAKIIITVGGYFDYISGDTYTPPRWSGKVGLEWFFRLVTDPKRLFYRYIIEPWSLIPRLLAEFKK